MYDTPAVSMAQLQELNSAETVVLTVNKRYARRLLGHLSARLAGAGGTVAVPEIVPLGAWLAQASDQNSMMTSSPVRVPTTSIS